jgi:rare lipoprotein A
MSMIRQCTAIALTLLASGCATSWQDSAPSNYPSAPSNEQRTASGELPKSRYGNPPLYEVFGKRYYVMNSSLGFEERGTASWYGKKFHGRKTSSGEIYNMYAMTAAHKSLPLPTMVRVTNLRNGNSVIVRVNDRGPFVGDRVIDMSYAAAKELGMVQSGTAPVEIIALNPTPVSQAAPAVIAAAPAPAAPAQPATPAPTKLTAQLMYVQAGAFGAEENAQRFIDRLAAAGIANAFIAPALDSTAVLYRVRIGPLDGVAAYDDAVATLASLDVRELRLIFEPAPEREETAGLLPTELNDG